MSGIVGSARTHSGIVSDLVNVNGRIKEFSRFHYGSATSTTSTGEETLNISGSLYCTITPEAVGDLLEFSFGLNQYTSAGYSGLGIQRSAATNFGSPSTVWSMGEHGLGQFGHQSDMGSYLHSGGTVNNPCSGLTPGTPYYYRVIGMTHTSAGTFNFGIPTSASTNAGVFLSVKRWSIV